MSKRAATAASMATQHPPHLPRHFYLDASDKVEEFWALTRTTAAEGAFVYSLSNLADT